VAARSEQGKQTWFRTRKSLGQWPELLDAPYSKVWEFKGQIVAVSFVSEDASRGFKPAEYCFWPNGKLARLVVEPQRNDTSFVPTYWSRRNVGIERIYAPDGRQLLTSVIPSPQRLKSEVTSFVYPTSSYFFDVHQLPFFNEVVTEP
jgi:hypothetical protein